jgi:hypothetical protein
MTTVEACLLLWACRIGLWLAPFERVLAWAQWVGGRFSSKQRLSPGQVLRGISGALPLTWHCSCLTQALAGWIMLTRHGAASTVKIGVASPADRAFAAHAWLEYEGRVILGDIGLEPYNVIWSLPSQ